MICKHNLLINYFHGSGPKHNLKFLKKHSTLSTIFNESSENMLDILMPAKYQISLFLTSLWAEQQLHFFFLIFIAWKMREKNSLWVKISWRFDFTRAVIGWTSKRKEAFESYSKLKLFAFSLKIFAHCEYIKEKKKQGEGIFRRHLEQLI